MTIATTTTIQRCIAIRGRARIPATAPKKWLECTQLEPRLLFSASPIPLEQLGFDIDPGHTPAVDSLAHSDAVAPIGNEARAETAAAIRELVLVDHTLPDVDQLRDALQQSDTLVVMLTKEVDGIDDITEILSHFEDLEALHIVSHGSAGSVVLGNTVLDSASLKGSASDVARWGDSLSADADILFYGCDLAADDAGVELIESISQLTGRDVAASDDLTGHAALGGDYDLEYATGAIHTGIVFDDGLQQSWTHTLTADLVARGETAIHDNDAGHANSTNQHTLRDQDGNDSSVALSPDTGNSVVVYTSEGTDSNDDKAIWKLFDRWGDELNSGTLTDSTLTSQDHSPSVAMDDAGNFYIAWVSVDATTSDADIYAQFFDSQGNDRFGVLHVNDSSSLTGVDTQTGHQLKPDIAVNSIGTVVTIVWEGPGTMLDGTDPNGIYAKTYSATNANPLTSPIRLHGINSSLSHSNAAVAIDDSGQSFATWNQLNTNDNEQRIALREFESDGTFPGLRLQMVAELDLDLGNGTETVSVETMNPSIDVADDGTLIAVATEWTHVGQSVTQSGVVVQAIDPVDYNDPFDLIDSTVFVTEESPNGQTDPSISLTDGAQGAIVSWSGSGDINGFVDNSGVWIRHLTVTTGSDGNPLFERDGGDVLVNSTTAGDQLGSTVAASDDSTYIVAWSGNGVGDSNGVFTRRFGSQLIDARDDSATTTENSTVDIDVLNNDDAPLANNVTISLSELPPNSGTITTTTDNKVQFDPFNDFDHLAVGESQQVTFQYVVTHPSGQSDRAEAVVNVTGVNDSPQHVTTSISVTQQMAPFSSAIPVIDADTTDTHTFSNLRNVTGDQSGLTIDLTSGTFSIDPTAYQSLGANETATIHFEVDATDPHGASAVSGINITVVGTNDPPTSTTFTRQMHEDAPGLIFSLPVTDVDSNDSHTFSNVTHLDGDTGGVTLSADGGTYEVAPSSYNYLAAGETEIIRYQYDATDSSGSTATNILEVHILGRNDAPTTSDDFVALAENGTYVFTAADFPFRDIDEGANFDHMTVTELPSRGMLQLDGIDVVANQQISTTDIDNGLLTFRPDANTNGTPYTTFQFQVVDEALSSNTATMEIRVAAGGTISGRVIEDIAGDGMITDDPGLGGVTVYLYQDDGNEIADAGDQLVQTTTTNEDGLYLFTTETNQHYWIAFDSRSIQSPQGGFTGGSSANQIWAEQTYATSGALIDDGSAFGGRQAGVSDDTSTLMTSQHVIGTTLSFANGSISNSGGSSAANSDTSSIVNSQSSQSSGSTAAAETPTSSGNDIGFSFNVVTSVIDTAAVNRGQGTLRQFVNNANAIAGANAMRFTPVASQNSSDGTHWQIVVNTELPDMFDDLTTIDGRAYSATAIGSIIDSNEGVLTDHLSDPLITGTQNHTLESVEAPELHITRNGNIDNVIGHGLHAVGDDITIEYIAIDGFGTLDDSAGGNIVVGHFGSLSDTTDRFTLRHSVIGRGADSFAMSAGTISNAGDNINVDGATDGRIEHNLIGHADGAGIELTTVSGWTITNNEIRLNSLSSTHDTAILINGGSFNNSIQGNFIAGNFGTAIDLIGSSHDNVIDSNTITDNGFGNATVQLGGVRIYGNDNQVIHNVIKSNVGDGVLVLGDIDGVGASQGVLISQNHFSANKGLAIDLSGNSTMGDGDSVTLNDGVQSSTTHANRGLDFPELTAAHISLDGLTLTATGSAPANTTVEFYLAASDSSDSHLDDHYGEGAVYLGSVVTDGTGAFTTTLTLTNPVSVGAMITSVAIDFSTNNTSEFSKNVQVCETPTGVEDTYTIPEDTVLTVPVSIGVLSNDSGDSNHSFKAALVAAPNLATISGFRLNADGSFELTPAAHFSGTTSFTYRIISDCGASSDPITVTVEVTAKEDQPIAHDDFYTTNEDQQLQGNVIRDGTQDVGEGLSATLLRSPTHGQVKLQTNGNFLYIPDADFHGTDSFEYQITDATGATSAATVHINPISPINDKPVATGDAFEGSEDESLEIDVSDILSNDLDIDGDSLSAAIKTQPAHGTVLDLGNGKWRYVPKLNFHGIDKFRYEVSDGQGGSHAAFVTIDVRPFNDNPVAGADRFETDEDTSVTFTHELLLANDSDPEAEQLVIQLLDQPSHGTLTENGDGTFTFTPDANFSGSQRVQYRVSDASGGSSLGVINFDVQSVNDRPHAVGDRYQVIEGGRLGEFRGVLQNDSDIDDDVLTARLIGGPKHGQFSLNSDGSFVYLHDGSETTEDSFTYEATDAQGMSHVAVVSIAITPINDAPIANDDAYRLAEDSRFTADRLNSTLSNDLDADSTDMRTSISVPPLHGSVQLNADGTFTYTPSDNFVGTDRFEYAVTDEGGATSTASVTLTVDAVNDPPVATDESYTSSGSTLLSVTEADGVLRNAFDIDDSELTAVIVSEPTQGSLTLRPDGSFDYNSAGAVGTVEFSYQVTDGTNFSDTKTVSIDVGQTIIPIPVTTGDTNKSEDSTTDSNEVDGNNSNELNSDIDPPSELETAILGNSDSLNSNNNDDDDDDDEVTTLPPTLQVASEASDVESTARSIALGQDIASLENISEQESTELRSAERHVSAPNNKAGVRDNVRPANQAATYRSDRTLLTILSASSFIEGLDSVGKTLSIDTTMPELIAGSVVAATSTLSVGYFFWVVRTGYFVASCLSAAPTWRSFDPLPIIDSALDDEDDEEKTEQDKQLEALLDK